MSSLTARGNPSVDVEDFYSRGGMLKPIAAHKGSGLSLATGAARWDWRLSARTTPSSNGTAPPAAPGRRP